jgi:hypothetical protein
VIDDLIRSALCQQWLVEGRMSKKLGTLAVNVGKNMAIVMALKLRKTMGMVRRLRFVRCYYLS